MDMPTIALNTSAIPARYRPDGQGSQNNACDIFIVSERLPEVTVENIIGPMPILHQQWAIQPQFLPKGISLFFCSIRAKHRQNWVARDKMNERESNERNEDNHNGSGDEPAKDKC